MPLMDTPVHLLRAKLQASLAKIDREEPANAPPPTRSRDCFRVSQAIHHLRVARELLKSAAAPRASVKVRRALKSAEGAERNALCRMRRALAH